MEEHGRKASLRHSWVWQWLVLGSDKDVTKEKLWAKEALATKGVTVHSRNAIINAIMQQAVDRHSDVLLRT